MKTRSMKLQCDNLQKHNDFSKSAYFCVLQMTSIGVASMNSYITPVVIQKPYLDLFGCGHKGCLEIVKRKGVELVEYYLQEENFTYIHR